MVMQQCLIVVLISLSLVINDVEYLFMWFLQISIFKPCISLSDLFQSISYLSHYLVFILNLNLIFFLLIYTEIQLILINFVCLLKSLNSYSIYYIDSIGFSTQNIMFINKKFYFFPFFIFLAFYFYLFLSYCASLKLQDHVEIGVVKVVIVTLLLFQQKAVFYYKYDCSLCFSEICCMKLLSSASLLRVLVKNG